jgi:hypothetical protein
MSKYVIKWRDKGFTIPVKVEYKDENGARIVAVSIISRGACEELHFTTENESGENDDSSTGS